MTSGNQVASDSTSSVKEAYTLKRNFQLMCIAFATNISCVISCLTYASTLLGPAIGGYGGGVLFVSYALTSFLLAQPIVSMMGPRNGLFIGCGGYAIYVFGFLISILLPVISLPLFCMSSAIGGVSGGFLWVAQGRYFSKNAKMYADVTSKPVEEVNSTFAAIFATYFLGLECSLRALASVIFIGHGEAAQDIVFSVYTAVALLSLYLLRQISDLGEAGTWDFDWEYIVKHTSSTFHLMYSDRRLSLLVPFQVAYGLASSFVPFYVFGTVIGDSENLGKTYLGLLSAIIPLTGSVIARPAAWVANSVGNWGNAVNMTLGAAALALTGLIVLGLPNSELGTWSIVVPYLLIYGIGRGCRESTSKAVVADFFASSPEKITTAFAGVSFSSGLASAFGYFVFNSLSRDEMATLVAVSCLVGIVSYYIAAVLHILEYKDGPSTTQLLPAGESNSSLYNGGS